MYEDEPRKVPKPIPFSQNSSLQPIVPEVSLILQEGNHSTGKATSSFSGTEFQTYNAWRWKNVNDKEKTDLSSKTHLNDPSPYVGSIVRDKFSGSDIERRKNEILYGSADEPRRPLPPLSIPDIPKCLETPFSDSFNTHKWLNDSKDDDQKFPQSSGCYGFRNSNSDGNVFEVRKAVKGNSSTDLYDIRDLYQIISQQNSQMSFLQEQIKKLLTSQSVKERQIEQLLKTQETKENKIEQLLKLQEMKENYIEQLVKAQEKHEKQIEQLIEIQKNKEQEKNELERRYKSKECMTVGVMTEIIKTTDQGTNTSLHCCCKNDCNIEVKNVQEKSEACNKQTGKGEKSLTFNSLDLPRIEEHIPSPQSSIHVDIPEYNDSSDEETVISSPFKKQSHEANLPESKPMGYTFYKNIITQVNDIIQSPENKENGEIPPEQSNYEKYGLEIRKSDPRKYTCLRENNFQVIGATRFGADHLDKLWQFGLQEEDMDFQQGRKLSSNSCKDITEYTPQGTSDTKDTQQSPSDISLKMNALALKYLNKEQMSNYHIESESKRIERQHDVTIYNVTNLSFGTMSYFERYRMSSNTHDGANGVHSPHQLLRKKAKAAVQNNKTKNS